MSKYSYSLLTLSLVLFLLILLSRCNLSLNQTHQSMINGGLVVCKLDRDFCSRFMDNNPHILNYGHRLSTFPSHSVYFNNNIYIQNSFLFMTAINFLIFYLRMKRTKCLSLHSRKKNNQVSKTRSKNMLVVSSAIV